jgi:hypothetical protein
MEDQHARDLDAFNRQSTVSVLDLRTLASLFLLVPKMGYQHLKTGVSHAWRRRHARIRGPSDPVILTDSTAYRKLPARPFHQDIARLRALASTTRSRLLSGVTKKTGPILGPRPVQTVNRQPLARQHGKAALVLTPRFPAAPENQQTGIDADIEAPLPIAPPLPLSIPSLQASLARIISQGRETIRRSRTVETSVLNVGTLNGAKIPESLQRVSSTRSRNVPSIHVASTSVHPMRNASPTKLQGQFGIQERTDSLASASPQSISTGQSLATLHIDGGLLGRWVAKTLEREVTRPCSGITAVDPRITPGWAGPSSGI